MKQKKLIFNFFVNRNCKKLTDSRKRANILADSRKSHHPIETLVEEIRFLSGLRENLGQDLPTRNIIIVKELLCFIPVVKSKCSLPSAEENSHILFSYYNPVLQIRQSPRETNIAEDPLFRLI